MQTLFYFIANRNTLTLADAAKLGLAYAFENSIDCAQVDNGPGNQPGVVCAQSDTYADGRLGYYRERQSWREIAEGVYVGHYRDERPGPDDLIRKKPLDGQPLELEDGNAWLCPVARSYSDRMEGEELQIYFHPQLPQKLELNNGRWSAGGVTPRYAALWELTEAWQRVRDGQATDDDRRRYDYQGQIEAAVTCLQANYRVGREELALLGLLNDELVVQILDQAIALPTFVSLVQKKTALAAIARSTPPPGAPSSAGPPGATPTTDPPGPT